ncbi:Hypothetical_protein [Hexamita inflata]|uniref:Hypothetical_protein n=1 Tax=Hexamita inflata TaxID=28002 RepID=A0AA86TZZ0_9EUKA|nr:Hypothetical protein HINF_LOCUS20942 [Hexamita inflata]
MLYDCSTTLGFVGIAFMIIMFLYYKVPSLHLSERFVSYALLVSLILILVATNITRKIQNAKTNRDILMTLRQRIKEEEELKKVHEKEQKMVEDVELKKDDKKNV